MVQWSSGELLRFSWILDSHAILPAQMLHDMNFWNSFVSGLMGFGVGMKATVCITRLKTSQILSMDSLTHLTLTSSCFTGNALTTITTELPCLGLSQHYPPLLTACFLFPPRDSSLALSLLISTLTQKRWNLCRYHEPIIYSNPIGELTKHHMGKILGLSCFLLVLAQEFSWIPKAWFLPPFFFSELIAVQHSRLSS